jgi:hypothetical protein
MEQLQPVCQAIQEAANTERNDAIRSIIISEQKDYNILQGSENKL